MAKADQYFKLTKNSGKVGVAERLDHFQNLKGLFQKKKKDLAELMTVEMGKPINASLAEVDKCVYHIDYYSGKAADFLKAEKLEDIEPKFLQSHIHHQPLGPTLCILPWNFPCWLVFKVGLGPLILGNPLLVKMSP